MDQKIAKSTAQRRSAFRNGTFAIVAIVGAVAFAYSHFVAALLVKRAPAGVAGSTESPAML